MAEQHFSAIIVGGRRGQMVSRFFCSCMRVERGKASRPGPGCGTSRTGSRLKMFYHWNDWRLWQPQGRIPARETATSFKKAAEQTSKMTSLNARLPGPSFIFRSHNLASECRINQSRRFGTLSSEGVFLGFPRCPSPYCLRRSLVVCSRSRSPLCPDRFNSSSGGIRSHTLPQDKQEPAWMWPRCLSYSPMATECFGSEIQLMLVQQYSESDSVQWEETSKSLIYYSESEELYEARRFVTEKTGPAAGKSL